MTAELMRIRAEMARRGLLTVQRGPYENPDTERTIYPDTEPESIDEAWRFLNWLDGLTANWRDGSRCSSPEVES